MICKWNTCTQTSTTLSDLYDHAISHPMEAPFVCYWENCGQVCHKKARLNSHLLTHIPHRAFTCKVCRKGFKREQELRRHWSSLHTTKFDLSEVSRPMMEHQSKMSLSMILN